MNCEIVDTVIVDCISPVEEPELLEQLSLFPNPSSGQLSLNVELIQLAKVDVEIYSAVGQKVKVLPTERFREKLYQLSLGDLPQGLYFVKIVIDDRQFITKRLMLIQP